MIVWLSDAVPTVIVIVFAVTALMFRAVLYAGSVARGYVLVLTLPSAVQVNDNLQVSLAGGWLDAEWEDPTVLADGTVLSGKTPSNVIDNSMLLAANYARPLSNGADLTFDIQYSRQGKGESMPPANPITNPSYAVVNLQFGYSNGPWDFVISVD